MFDQLFEEGGVLKHPKDRKKLKSSPSHVDDGQFERQYEYLKQTREFKSRPVNVNEHELADKLVALQKLESTFHDKLDPEELLGPTRSRKGTYFDAIMPISKSKPKVDITILEKPFAKKPINPFLPDSIERREQVRAARGAKRDMMVNSYRDRLLTRF